MRRIVSPSAILILIVVISGLPEVHGANEKSLLGYRGKRRNWLGGIRGLVVRALCRAPRNC